MGCGASKPAVVEEPQVLTHSHSKPVRPSYSNQLVENGTAGKPKSRNNSVTNVPDEVVEPPGRRKEPSGPLGPPDDRANSSVPTTTGPPGSSPSPRIGLVPKSLEAEQIAAGWPAWLAQSAGEAIRGWVPKRAESFEKLDKIGQGTYSNVYKARDLESGKLVALKKVRFDNLEPESVRFMAREIEVLRRLEHPNIVQLLGLVTSRMSCSLYLVFEYMEHDLAGLAACPGVSFTEPQVKCYMKQLLLGLEHCHTRGVLHRDIKGSNLLLDNKGQLKIADFGLATFYRPEENVPLTSRVVTLWYRPPELLLGATNYGVSVDLWSSGCILAELLAGKPIMPGRTEVEQLHKIFKLCGSPSEEYWRKSRLPHATIFKPTQPYKRCLGEMFKDFPSTSLQLLETLLAIDPAERGTSTAALKSDFFTTKPLPCDPSSLPEYPPSKEYDAKLREEEARRVRAAGGRGSRGGGGGAHDSKNRSGALAAGSASGNLGIGMANAQANRDRGGRAVPAPHANAEDPSVIAREKARHAMGAAARSKSDKFAVVAAEGGGGGGGYLPPGGHPHGQGMGPPGHHDMPHAPTHRMAGGGYPHISKSGPQPMIIPKTGGPQPPPIPAWAGGQPKQPPPPLVSTAAGGAGAGIGTEDGRMAPPRMTTRTGKPVTVPDFALAGGYPGTDAAKEGDLLGSSNPPPPPPGHLPAPPSVPVVASQSPAISSSSAVEGEYRREKSQTSLQGEYSHSHSHSVSYSSADFSAEQEASTGDSATAWKQPRAGYSGPLQTGRGNSSPGAAMGEKSGNLAERKRWAHGSSGPTDVAVALSSGRSGNLGPPGSLTAMSASTGVVPGGPPASLPSLPNGPAQQSAAALAAKEGKRRYMPRGEGYDAEAGF